MDSLSLFSIQTIICPRSSYQFNIVTYYIKLVTTSWTHSMSLFLKISTPPIQMSEDTDRDANIPVISLLYGHKFLLTFRCAKIVQNRGIKSKLFVENKNVLKFCLNTCSLANFAHGANIRW